MARALSFGEVLETVGRLSLEDQETLVHIIRRRVVEQRRAELTKDIREAREALEAGDVRPVTSDELMEEILS
jgi:hypothetical protein